MPVNNNNKPSKTSISYTPGNGAATTNPLKEKVRFADPKRDPDHADDELIETVHLPNWLGIGMQTNRPGLIGVGAPEELDKADTYFCLNLIRVQMETLDSLRKRLKKLVKQRDAETEERAALNTSLQFLSRVTLADRKTFYQSKLAELQDALPEAHLTLRGFFSITTDEPEEVLSTLDDLGYRLVPAPGHAPEQLTGWLQSRLKNK